MTTHTADQKRTDAIRTRLGNASDGPWRNWQPHTPADQDLVRHSFGDLQWCLARIAELEANA